MFLSVGFSSEGDIDLDFAGCPRNTVIALFGFRNNTEFLLDVSPFYVENAVVELRPSSSRFPQALGPGPNITIADAELAQRV
jgi:hypothetical protein